MQKLQLISYLATAKYIAAQKKEGIMMMKIAQAIGMGFGRIFGENESNSGLVRLFEVEYNREYRMFRKSGIQIDANFVRTYLKTR